MKESLDDLEWQAREMLDRSTAERMPFFPTTVFARRGGETVAGTAFPPDRDLMLTVLEMMVTGFDLSEVSFIIDTYSAPTDTNPITGKTWGPGEMAKVAEYDRGVERGWVHDALMLGRAERESGTPSVDIRMLPYRLHGRSVEYLQPRPLIGGYVEREVRKMMTAPTIWDPGEIGLDPADQPALRLRLDVAVVRVIATVTGVEVSLIADPGSARGNLAFDLSPERN